MKELANTEYKDNQAFVPQPMNEKDEIFKYNEVLKEKLSELSIAKIVKHNKNLL